MSETAAPDLAAMTREVLDRIRYVVLGTVDEDGRTRTSPVYFKPHRYEDLYWVPTRRPTPRSTWSGTAG